MRELFNKEAELWYIQGERRNGYFPTEMKGYQIPQPECSGLVRRVTQYIVNNLSFSGQHGNVIGMYQKGIPVDDDEFQKLGRFYDRSERDSKGDLLEIRTRFGGFS